MFDMPTCVSDDYNRVVLDQLPDVPDSDYINASYVDVSIPAKLSNFLSFFFSGYSREYTYVICTVFSEKKNFFQFSQFVRRYNITF